MPHDASGSSDEGIEAGAELKPSQLPVIPIVTRGSGRFKIILQTLY